MKAELERMRYMGSYADLTHGRVRYQLDGPEDAPTVVLVHGLAGHLHIWDRNYQHLVDSGFRVLRFDLYGRGLSDRVRHPHTADLFVLQLREMLDHVRVDKPVHLVGLSMGGAVITRFATAHPDAVGSMTWVCCFAFPRPRDLVTSLTRIPVVGEALMGSIGGAVMRRATHRAMFDPKADADIHRWFTAPATIKGSKRAVLNSMRHFLSEDHSDHFKKAGEMRVPKTLIWGRHDRILPFAYGERVHDLMPDASFSVFEKSGHLPQYEEAISFNLLLKNRLKNLIY